MTFICSRMKDEEVNHLKEIFTAMDKNWDGHLSFEEIRDWLKKVNLDNDTIEDLFKKMDTDWSWMVDYTEFLASTASAKEIFKEEKLAEAFKAFDKDNSWKISVSEIY